MRVLRVCAVIVVIAALAMTGWLALDAPWFAGPEDLLRDPFYRAAHARALLPYAGVVAGVALVVSFAAGTAMARRWLAAAGLWSILAGGMLMLLFAGIEMGTSLFGGPLQRVETFGSAHANLYLIGTLGAAAGALLMLLGVLLWIVARFTGRRR